MKKLFLFRFLVFALFALAAFGANAQCLSGWNYYAPVKVSNGNPTDLYTYQVRLVVNTQDLISAGKMQSTGADIRFTDSATCTVLPYWIESGINTSNTVVWVKTTKIPQGGSQTINMYYGNASAIAMTNGDSTFDLFDDFNGTALNTNKWSKAGAGTSFWTVSGGSLTLKTRTPADAIIVSKSSFPSAITEEANVTSASGSSPSIAIINNGAFAGYTLSYSAGKMAFSEAISGCSSYKPGTSNGLTTTPGTTTGIWGIQWPETAVQNSFWAGGNFTSADTNRAISSAVNIAAGDLCSGVANATMTIDWIRVRKYAKVEPTTVVGKEKINNIITPIVSNIYCTGAGLQVPFAIVGTFTSGNTFTAQLSDSSGSFAKPTTIGSKNGTTADTISCTLPSNIYGDHYAVRIVSNYPDVTGYASAPIRILALPAANAGKDQSICAGDSATLGGAGTSGNTYSWTSSPAGFTSSASRIRVSPSVTTTYTLTETNANGCTGKNSVTVTVNAFPAANAGKSQSICAGSSAVIGATAISGNTYSWTSSPAGFTSTEANPTVNPSTTTTYTLVETNASGCSAKNSVTITVNPLPSANAGRSQTICLGGSTAIGSAAVSGSTYSWTSTPSGFTSTAANPTVSPSVTTTYTLTETNANGCVNSNYVTVTVSPLPSANAGQSKSVCSGSSVNIGATAVSGSTYSWTSSPAGFTSTDANPSVSPTVTTTYTVTETNANGCSNSNSVTVTILPATTVSLANFSDICVDAAAFTLKGGSPIGGTYSGDGVSNGIFNPAVAGVGTHVITYAYTNAGGCTATATATIAVKASPVPTITITGDTIFCQGGSVILTSSLGDSYSWSTKSSSSSSSTCGSGWASFWSSFGSGTSSTCGGSSSSTGRSITVTQSGTYYVTVSSNGCSKTSRGVTVIVNPSPTVSAGSDITYYYGYDACPTLTASTTTSGASYLWSTGATTQSITVCPTSTATYWVTVTNSSGCVSSKDYVTVTVVDVHCHDDEDYKGKVKDTTKKILICHKGVQMCVSKNAVAAYLKNGDHLGSCDGDGDDRDNGRSGNDGCGKTDAAVTTTGINEGLNVAQMFNVYPNPFSTTASIDLSFAKTQNVAIDVISIDGRIMQTLYSGNVVANTSYKLTLDAGNMNSGVYIVRVMSGDHIDYRRINLIR